MDTKQDLRAKKAYIYTTEQEILDELTDALRTSESAVIRLAIRLLNHTIRHNPEHLTEIIEIPHTPPESPTSGRKENT